MWAASWSAFDTLQAAASARLPRCEPAEAGLDAQALEQIDALVAQGLQEKKMPGCVVVVGRRGRIAWCKAYGMKQVEPEAVPMTVDTLFDLASLTKPIATATSIVQLAERGKLSLRDKVATHIPEFGTNGKDVLTLHDLLTHQSGLIADNPIGDYAQGPEEALRRIYDLKLLASPGTKFIYSDVNFIVLGEVVRRVSGEPLDVYSKRHLFEPLGMTETGYNPSEPLRLRAAPTERREERWMRGEVHDPRAFKLGGVAGHAGLFSTADDVAIYAQMMLDGGERQGVKILSPTTIATMTSGYRVPSGLRGLGWDKRTGYSTNRGDLLSESAFGHGGFTGTALWIDPKNELFVIFLSNRVHPNGKGLVNPLAGRIANVVASAIRPDSDQARMARPPGQTLTGLDILERESFRRLAGRKVGLITNHTGRSRSGASSVKLLHGAPNVSLVALFSPEHGFEGKLDIPKVADSQDQSTGLKVHSLYGATRRPTPEMLSGVDTLVFDIQDIGCRFYTYVSTMGEAMRAAAEHKVRFVVLDRPNPINGVDVAGPMLDAGRESFTAAHILPVRHGMTIGELARLFREEWKLELELEVVACEGWRRDHHWDDTGLVWVNPSPNMRSLNQALLYPGVGLLETTNLSVGRGTDTPFEWIGAPWLDGVKLSNFLRERAIPGVTFVPVEFTPTTSKFQGEKCGGVWMGITDRTRFDPLRLGIELALALRSTHADAWKAEGYDRLLASKKTHEAILANRSPTEVEAITRAGVSDFLRRRATVLLYD
jgi:uncharacterized protein YbbC (DUF1343 family)/CubicO group peptidase (beta-lactamase class C family)